MINPKFKATVKNGRLAFKDVTALELWIQTFSEDQELDVTIGKPKKKRSIDQNNYYWGGVLPPIANHTGNTCDELHEIFKRMFLRPQIVKYGQKNIRMPGSTAMLSTMEFSEYLERIIKEAAEMGVVIPPSENFT